MAGRVKSRWALTPFWFSGRRKQWQQVKIYGYGLKSNLAKNREVLSDAIRDALKEAFGLPPEKRFQRFIGLVPPGWALRRKI
ncbi:hypothetical protein [Desulforudis sp. DRI-14]|uniref:hypothetical protein n=1 Tax=Desulforudis sp. DRI-14 TaxID=3459793 RepID=UPI0040415D19